MRASSCANTTTRRARSVNRSNIFVAPRYRHGSRPAGLDRAPTSLTLVGNTLSCLVDHSSQTSLSDAQTADTGHLRRECVAIHNRQPNAEYSPLPVPTWQDRLSAQLNRRRGEKPLADMALSSTTPQAKLFAQGAMTIHFGSDWRSRWG